jgi:hypothetical protein
MLLEVFEEKPYANRMYKETARVSKKGNISC